MSIRNTVLSSLAQNPNGLTFEELFCGLPANAISPDDFDDLLTFMEVEGLLDRTTDTKQVDHFKLAPR